MLTISPNAVNAFRIAGWPGFVERVRSNLFETYPHFLPCFPEAVQSQIVRNMLDRARYWGLLQQASLYAFCKMMVEVAPNFDEQPEIAQVINDLGERRDYYFPDFAAWLPQNLNKLARDRASTLPLFVPAELRDGPIHQRVTAAIWQALGDRQDAANASQAATDAIAQTTSMSFAAFEDAPLVIAACRSFWGPDFVHQPWAVQLARERWSPGELLGLLRLRIALEFGRYL